MLLLLFVLSALAAVIVSCSHRSPDNDLQQRLEATQHELALQNELGRANDEDFVVAVAVAGSCVLCVLLLAGHLARERRGRRALNRFIQTLKGRHSNGKHR